MFSEHDRLILDGIEIKDDKYKVYEEHINMCFTKEDQRKLIKNLKEEAIVNLGSNSGDIRNLLRYNEIDKVKKLLVVELREQLPNIKRYKESTRKLKYGTKYSLELKTYKDLGKDLAINPTKIDLVKSYIKVFGLENEEELTDYYSVKKHLRLLSMDNLTTEDRNKLESLETAIVYDYHSSNLNKTINELLHLEKFKTDEISNLSQMCEETNLKEILQNSDSLKRELRFSKDPNILIRKTIHSLNYNKDRNICKYTEDDIKGISVIKPNAATNNLLNKVLEKIYSNIFVILPNDFLFKNETLNNKMGSNMEYRTLPNILRTYNRYLGKDLIKIFKSTYFLNEDNSKTLVEELNELSKGKRLATDNMVFRQFIKDLNSNSERLLPYKDLLSKLLQNKNLNQIHTLTFSLSKYLNEKYIVDESSYLEDLNITIKLRFANEKFNALACANVHKLQDTNIDINSELNNSDSSFLRFNQDKIKKLENLMQANVHLLGDYEYCINDFVFCNFSITIKDLEELCIYWLKLYMKDIEDELITLARLSDVYLFEGKTVLGIKERRKVNDALNVYLHNDSLCRPLDWYDEFITVMRQNPARDYSDSAYQKMYKSIKEVLERINAITAREAVMLLLDSFRDTDKLSRIPAGLYDVDNIYIEENIYLSLLLKIRKLIISYKYMQNKGKDNLGRMRLEDR